MNLLALIILINSINPSHQHHVIFENIGQMASAVTYIHAKVTINFTTIEDQYLMYRSVMSGYDEYLNDRYNDPPSTTNVTKDKDHRTKLSWDDIWHTNVQQCREVVRFRQKNANWILVAMETARGAMPP